MTDTASPEPPTFDCRARRHKVITNDGICILCGARRVVDARTLPATSEPAPAAEQLTL